MVAMSNAGPFDGWVFDAETTLQDIARETYWEEGLPLPGPDKVAEALKAAGFDPGDEKERQRFLNLVRSQSHFRNAEEIARLALHYDRAIEEGYSEKDARCIAVEYANEERQMREDEERDA